MTAVATVAATTVARRARAVAGLTGTRDLGLRLWSVSLSRKDAKRQTHVGDAVDGNSLEVVLVELLNSGLEVGSSLVLDETLATSAGSVTLTVDFAVDDIEAGLAGEVLQVLIIELVSEVQASNRRVEVERRPEPRGTYLPAGLEGKPGDRHTMNGATRARSHAFLSVARAITRAGASTCELDNQTLAHELGAI